MHPSFRKEGSTAVQGTLDKNTDVWYYLAMARKDNSKDSILSNAVQLASIQGLNGLTIGTLAEAVGMSKGGISAHFKTKTDLQLAVIERAAALFYEAVILPTARHSKGITRLYALSEAWFRYIESHVFAGGCFFTNVLLEVDDLDDQQVAHEVARQYNRYIEFIERCTREAVELGELRADLPIATFALELHGISLAALVWSRIRVAHVPFTMAKEAINGLIERNKPALR